MKRINSTNPGNWLALVARLAAGITIFSHGAQKMLGWFGGYGFRGTLGYLTGVVHLPYAVACGVIFVEFFASLLLIAGVLTRVAAFALLLHFLGVLLVVHIHNGFFMNWGMEGGRGEGIEYFVLLLGLLVINVLAGGGKASVDALVYRKDSVTSSAPPVHTQIS